MRPASVRLVTSAATRIGLLIPVEQSRSGEDCQRTIARAFVSVPLLASRDVAEQSGENRAMNGVVGRVAFVETHVDEIPQRAL